LKCHFLLANGKERTLVGWRREKREGEEAEVSEALRRLEEEIRLEADFVQRKSEWIAATGSRQKLGKEWRRSQLKAAMESAAADGASQATTSEDAEDTLGLASTGL
jgi:hypothetical protein